MFCERIENWIPTSLDDLAALLLLIATGATLWAAWKAFQALRLPAWAACYVVPELCALGPDYPDYPDEPDRERDPDRRKKKDPDEDPDDNGVPWVTFPHISDPKSYDPRIPLEISVPVNAKVHNWEAIDEESEELFVHIPDNDAPDLGKASLTDENGRRDLVEIAIGRKPFYDFEIVGKEQADQNDPELRLEAGLRQIWSKEESLFSGASNDFGIVAILQRIWYRALEGASREYRVDGEMYYGMSVQGGGEPDSPSGNLDDLDKVQFREKVHAPQVGKKKTKDQKKWAYIVDFPREKPFSDVHGWEAAWFGEKRGEKAWAVEADQMFHYRTSRLDLRGVVPESGFHIEKAAFVDERSDTSRTCWSLTVTKHAEAVTIDGESTEAGLLEGGSGIRETFEIPCADPKEKKRKRSRRPSLNPSPNPSRNRLRQVLPPSRRIRGLRIRGVSPMAPMTRISLTCHRARS